MGLIGSRVVSQKTCLLLFVPTPSSRDAAIVGRAISRDGTVVEGRSDLGRRVGGVFGGDFVSGVCIWSIS